MVLCGDTDAVAKLDINDPGNPQNKHRTRESQRQLRALLMEWDPIGVAGAPEAADEYDCMLSPLLRRLHDGVSDKEIQDWVAGEVEGHFGLHSDRDREAQLVRQIIGWWRHRATQPPAG